MPVIPLVMEPDPDEPDCALPFVDVLVDGRPYAFVLDTGARSSVIVSDEHTRALPVVGTDHSSGLFESTPTVVVEVGRVEVGEIVRTSVPMSLTDPDDRDAGCLLGMDVLGGQALEIDLAAGTLTVLPPGPAAMPLDRDDAGHCFVDVAWGAVTARACIDTGAAITVLSERFAHAHPELLHDERTSIGRGNGGARVETPTFTVSGYTIGGVAFAPHVVAVVELPLDAAGTDLILGCPSLVQARWTLDLAGDTWSVGRS